MGFDVYGNQPRSTAGEYFRCTVWYWPPLWSFCRRVAPALCEDVDGYLNSGDGLDDHGARQLAALLQDELESGRCAAYADEFEAHRLSLPPDDPAVRYRFSPRGVEAFVAFLADCGGFAIR